MPELTIQERGKEAVWTHECIEPVITIGRLDSNVIQLKTDGVSRQHAKVVSEGENFFLVDLKSGNGTQLNGMPVKSGDKNLIKAGDTISIDVFDLKFQEGASAFRKAVEEEVTDSDILEVKLLKKVITALDKEMVPSLEVLNGSAEGKKILFTDEMNELTIGRDPECDFPVNEYVISRKHAKVIKRWGGIAIRDLESKNGSFLNNRRVVEEYLHDGDRIALGTIVFLFRNPQEINLSQFGDVKPKFKPATVEPKDIPGLEEVAQEEEAPEEEAGQEAEPSAEEEWEKLESSVSKASPYPTPEPRKRMIKVKGLTPVEIGMIGLGVLVFIFALITIVNLLAS